MKSIDKLVLGLVLSGSLVFLLGWIWLCRRFWAAASPGADVEAGEDIDEAGEDDDSDVTDESTEPSLSEDEAQTAPEPEPGHDESESGPETEAEEESDAEGVEIELVELEAGAAVDDSEFVMGWLRGRRDRV